MLGATLVVHQLGLRLMGARKNALTWSKLFWPSIFTHSHIFILFNRKKNHSKLNKSILDFLKYHWKNVKNFNMKKHSWWHVWKIQGDIYCDLKKIIHEVKHLFFINVYAYHIYMIKLSGLKVNKISNICEIFCEGKKKKRAIK